MKKLSYLLFFSAFSIQAAVYKCEHNGAVEFSQFPCADEAEQVDMRPLGTAMIGTRSEFKQQVDAIKRQGRFVEFQISQLEQEKQQKLDELKSDLYKLRRSFPKAEELATLQQKIDRLAQQYDEKISAEQSNLASLKTKAISLERQYAQN
jgi:predicted RNase H-like nuclease (RuvC/YqgF family)